MQEYQDNVDFDRPGGVLRKAPATLTKRDLENAQVSPNPDPDPNQVVEQGTHDVLLRREGVYASLVATQLQKQREQIETDAAAASAK